MSIVTSLRQARPAAAAGLRVAVECNFDFRSPEYRSLHRRSHATAFQAPDWLAGLYRRVVPAFAAEPLIVTMRASDDGRLVLVLPLVRRRRGRLDVAEFADFGLCDYNHPVYDPAEAPSLLADATLPERVGRTLDGCDVLSISKLTCHDPVLRRLFPHAWRARMRFSSYPARLGTDWAGWRAAKLELDLRQQLDSKRRRLAKKGAVAFRTVRDPAEIAAVFEHLRRFRADRFRHFGIDDPIGNDAVFSFYRHMAVQGALTGNARTHCLYLKDEPIAVAFGLAHRGAFLLLLLGSDIKRFRRLSIGLLTIEDSLRTGFEAGDAVYDFTVGDHPYKLQFAAETAPLYEWHVPKTISGYGAAVRIEIVREFKRAFKPLIGGAQGATRWLRRHRAAARRTQPARRS
jgi:CelD/BcsL family acetyltransferase involved in cellulose biosynthesis